MDLSLETVQNQRQIDGDIASELTVYKTCEQSFSTPNASAPKEDNKESFWTNSSFINMFIQTKYLEMLSKNQSYLDCIKQLTTNSSSSNADPRNVLLPQERPLDLSLKTDVLLKQEEPLMINTISLQHGVLKENVLNKRLSSPNAISLLDKKPVFIDVNTFSCLICEQQFNLQDRLAKHMASCHKQKKRPTESARSYECEICKRSFARSDMLTRHSRLHTGVKPYTCSVCRQVFSRSDHLSTHQRTHTGEKPYKCPYTQCQYAACRRDMINRHLRTHIRQDSKWHDANGSTSKTKISNGMLLSEIKSEL